MSDMASQPSSPTIRVNLHEERTRITNEIARIRKTLLLNGLATRAGSPGPIQEIGLHSRWDGIVGHPVEVNINFLIAAQPNIRHALIDESHASVKTAEITSITQATTPASEPVTTSPDYDRRGKEPIHCVPPTKDDHGLVVHANSLPETSKEPSTSHISEWSGDTLVASEVLDFLSQYHSPSPSEWTVEGGKVSTIARRLHPTLRSGMSPVEAIAPSNNVDLNKDLAIDIGLDCSRSDAMTIDEHFPVKEDFRAYGERSSSGGTMRVCSPVHAPQTPVPGMKRGYQTPTPSPGSSISPGALALEDRSPLGAVKRIKIVKKPTCRKPWQSPSQEDFSPSKKYRIGMGKSAPSSPSKVNITPKSDSRSNLLLKAGLPSTQANRCLCDQKTMLRSDDGSDSDNPHTTPSPPDTSARPWMIRRDITSSRWFQPLDPKREPFWIQLEGQLYLCFPSQSESRVYQVEVHAEIYLSKPDIEGWCNFSIPGLPRLQNQPSGRITFFQKRGHEVSLDKTSLDYTEDSGPYLLSGGSHFGDGVLLRLRFQPSPGLHSQYLLENPRDEDYTATNSRYPAGLKAQPQLKNSGLESPELQSYFRNMSPLAMNQKNIDSKQGDAEPVSVNGLSQAANRPVRLDPVYFAGLHGRDDPLEPGNFAKMAWDFDMCVDRLITGELEIYMSLRVPVGTIPLVIINARDWVPDFSIINGYLATEDEWIETANGDMALHNIACQPVGKVVKVEVYWREDAVVDGSADRESPPLKQYRLPHIVDKAILNGGITCTIDGALIELNDFYNEISWRADSLIGCTSIKLPKLWPGYRMDLKVDENYSAIVDDDHRSLPHVNFEPPSDAQGSKNDHEDQRNDHLSANTQNTVATQVYVLPKADQLSRSSSYSSLVNDAETSTIPDTTPDEEVSRVTQATALVGVPFTSRQVIRFCMVIVLLLQLFHRINTRLQLDSQNSPQGLWRDAADQRYGDLLDDLSFDLDVSRAAEVPMEEQHHPSAEQKLEGNIGRVEAESLKQGGPQNMARRRNWRDSIDRALGWREIQD